MYRRKRRGRGGREKEKGIISLHFNGKLLTIIVNKDDKEIERISFQAVSGSPQKSQLVSIISLMKKKDNAKK